MNLFKMIFFLISFYLFTMNMFCWMMAIYFILINQKIIIEWDILIYNSMNLEYTMYFDWMNLIFMSTVLLISSMVIMYSINYMENDLFMKRFMLMIMMFILSMIFMIISPNMLSILLGWDGLGLTSYCLVAYYSSKKSFNSSMITILMNRIGDIMIIIMIGLMIIYGSWNFLFLKNMNITFMFLIMTAAITKSAQIPFSSWLPLAMAAPTPVSSLVHSSTLVTAGVYLLIRFNYLMNKNFMMFMMMLSCLTMTMAGSSANLEFDFKKIIALSTLSQLGLMIMTISLNFPKLAFFHLITHAMFKSLLFLCSGIVIHNFFNNQDIRYISFLNMNMPFINLTLNISSLTLCGMPFLTGFYSKDLIIEIFLMNKFNWLIFFMMFMSMTFTISYTFRLIFYTSLKNLKMTMFNFYKSFNLMNYSIIILLFMTMFYGSMLNWLILSSLNIIFLPKTLKLLIYWFLMIGIIMSLYLSNKKFLKFNTMYMLLFINSMWFLSIFLKKNKMNLFLYTEKMIFNMELKWSEFFINNYINNNLMLLLKKKSINLLNFLLLMMMMMYLLLMMMMY